MLVNPIKDTFCFNYGLNDTTFLGQEDDMNKPCIVGIAGGSASGKTTIVNKLKASFGDDILVISHDSLLMCDKEVIEV